MAVMSDFHSFQSCSQFFSFSSAFVVFRIWNDNWSQITPRAAAREKNKHPAKTSNNCWNRNFISTLGRGKTWEKVDTAGGAPGRPTWQTPSILFPTVVFMLILFNWRKEKRPRVISVLSYCSHPFSGIKDFPRNDNSVVITFIHDQL